jgi:hypothetical protein
MCILYFKQVYFKGFKDLVKTKNLNTYILSSIVMYDVASQYYSFTNQEGVAYEVI